MIQRDRDFSFLAHRLMTAQDQALSVFGPLQRGDFELTFFHGHEAVVGRQRPLMRIGRERHQIAAEAVRLPDHPVAPIAGVRIETVLERVTTGLGCIRAIVARGNSLWSADRMSRIRLPSA